MTSSLAWPAPPGQIHKPSWTDQGFMLGEKHLPVLSYRVGQSGWSDDLTNFHQDNAGPDHFIDRASRRHTLSQVAKALPRPDGVILEVGCSSGYLLRELTEAFPQAEVIGTDYISAPLLGLSEQLPRVPLVQFDLLQCPLPDASVDVVVLINVLEHIDDDEAALKQVQRILKPGGSAIIEVPAGPHLYDVYDKVLLHFRRYRLKQLCETLEKHGLKVQFGSSLGALLYPGFWYVKNKNRKYLEAPAEVQKSIVANAITKSRRNRFFEFVMWLEDGLRRILPLNFGIRCLATAVKPLH